MDWIFQREESGFSPIDEGDYRIRVAEVEKKVSKAGNDMLSFKFDVSGKAGYLFHNITFLKDRPEITNRMLTQFFDSFKDISEGNLTLANWVGKVGACHVKHEEYNGEMQAKIGYFIKADKQSGLPAWQEPQRKANGSAPAMPTDSNGFVDTTGMEIPF